ncbi:dethiobiotin synthase [Gynuella sunshinyii]|uniref:ATP-dependent dethiobiotin synthetase BioD n=1 Tax=Gynuella sunshinyii YC6258 TaxID=1445510 RepID=A0A0C5W3W7_9GAMM|nr:dethiobiotin synthase [Gynuella sunshinyii]AJQ97309.1 dethiobiotin synthetase [Gynuella sunshinyii YC6258]
MAPAFIITGTDTDIGKTVASAIITVGLHGNYWKPIQAGNQEFTDTQMIKQLTGLPDDHFFPESYILSQPLSPHRAAELEGIEIRPETLRVPVSRRPLIIEGAGGLLVPITRNLLQIDLFERWNLPVILCARSGLGTINHTLLSIEALNNRNIKILGLVLIGEKHADNLRTILEYSGINLTGQIPVLEDLGPAALKRAFHSGFNIYDFDINAR